jgi:uncharacterized protein (UPF0333 family)
MILAFILVIVIVVVAVLAALLKRPHSTQSRISQKMKKNAVATETPAASQTQAGATQTVSGFCPSCGNKLLSTEGSCPFCHADLSQWYQNNKK